MPRAAPRFRLTHPPAPLEDAEHRLLADCLRRFLGPPGVVNRDGVLWFSIEHRNAASAIEGARRKRCGVVGGVPDLMLCRGARTVWLELKRSRDGILSRSQKLLQHELRAVGHTVFLARGAEHALELLAAEGFPLRGRISA